MPAAPFADRLLREALESLAVERRRLTRGIETMATILGGVRKPLASAPTRRRRRMTAAERQAVSVRMRKYWAKRRKAS